MKQKARTEARDMPQSVHSTVHSWTKRQKTAKNEIQKIREIDGSYLCLQRLDKLYIWSAGNDQKWQLFEFAETLMEKLVKPLGGTYFRRVLAFRNHCAVGVSF
jgi:hypothetical protein